MPVFSSSLVYKEWARVLCERSFNLNASNSKKLVFGLSPFQLTSNVRKSDPEINVDFDFVLKIVDVKYGSSVSIFGNEIESFLSKIVKLKSAPKPNVGNVLICDNQVILIMNFLIRMEEKSSRYFRNLFIICQIFFSKLK